MQLHIKCQLNSIFEQNCILSLNKKKQCTLLQNKKIQEGYVFFMVNGIYVIQWAIFKIWGCSFVFSLLALSHMS